MHQNTPQTGANANMVGAWIQAGVRSFAFAKGRNGKAVLVACFFDNTSPPKNMAKLFEDSEQQQPLQKLKIGSRFDGSPVEMLQIVLPTGSKFVAGQLACAPPMYPNPSTCNPAKAAKAKAVADDMCNEMWYIGDADAITATTGWAKAKNCFLTAFCVNQTVPKALALVHEAQLGLLEAAAGGAYQTKQDKADNDVQPNAFARRMTSIQITVAGNLHDDVVHRGADAESVRLICFPDHGAMNPDHGIMSLPTPYF